MVVVISVDSAMTRALLPRARRRTLRRHVAAEVEHLEPGDFEHDADRFLPMSWVSPCTTPITTARPGRCIAGAICGRRMATPAYIASAAISSSGTKYSSSSNSLPARFMPAIRPCSIVSRRRSRAPRLCANSTVRASSVRAPRLPGLVKVSGVSAWWLRRSSFVDQGRRRAMPPGKDDALMTAGADAAAASRAACRIDADGGSGPGDRVVEAGLGADGRAAGAGIGRRHPGQAWFGMFAQSGGR